MRKIILAISAIIVVVVAAITIYAKWFTDTEQHFTGVLSEIVPAELPGWQVEEVSLAESQGEINQVEKTLRFDQYASRRYKKGGLEITFYAAYWRPGERSPIDAGGHNPDSCWVNFGWTRTQREYSVAGTKVNGREFQPYEFGVYEKEGVQIPVMFWHLLNGKPHSYNDHRDGWKDGIAGVIFRFPKRIEDLRRLGLNQRREQLFIRISFTGQQFDAVLANPDFADFMEKIDGLGIFLDKTWGDGGDNKAAATTPAHNDDEVSGGNNNGVSGEGDGGEVSGDNTVVSGEGVSGGNNADEIPTTMPPPDIDHNADDNAFPEIPLEI
ncbi:MAG: exosortase-associated EpsI family protein [Opitutae bacterium]|nr:exosortase-associated EpsI family protein [Opitutae bacterium]MCD8298212.1 exosortase-associated EpsI family protein [Opitutae bacterium]